MEKERLVNICLYKYRYKLFLRNVITRICAFINTSTDSLVSPILFFFSFFFIYIFFLYLNFDLEKKYDSKLFWYLMLSSVTIVPDYDGVVNIGYSRVFDTLRPQSSMDSRTPTSSLGRM